MCLYYQIPSLRSFPRQPNFSIQFLEILLKNSTGQPKTYFPVTYTTIFHILGMAGWIAPRVRTVQVLNQHCPYNALFLLLQNSDSGLIRIDTNPVLFGWLFGCPFLTIADLLLLLLLFLTLVFWCNLCQANYLTLHWITLPTPVPCTAHDFLCSS